MTNIKLVAWDVYGTIIASGYCDDENLFLRPNALELIREINKKGIEQCTCSDSDLGNLKRDLKEVGINWTDFFIDLYKFTPYQQKDFSYIIEINKILPENLLVIGNNYDIDLALAERIGCRIFHTPEIEQRSPIDKEGMLRLLQ